MQIKFIKKGLYLVFIIGNLFQNVEAIDFHILENEEKIKNNKIVWSKMTEELLHSKHKNSFEKIKYNSKKISNKENFKDDYKELTENPSRNKNELVIQSDIQSEKNNILYAEGNVVVSFRGNFLKADRLIYDKTREIINAKGNISLIIGKQLFSMDQFQYDLKNKQGNLSDVKGILDTDYLIKNLYADFNNSDIKKIEGLQDLKKDKVLNTPNKVNNWFFASDSIKIDGDKWKSEKVILTNDLLELKQIKIEVNSMEASSVKEEIRFKSSLNYLTLDEKVSIPFWFGNRRLDKFGKNLNYSNKWNLGYDSLDKDGLFIGRRLNTLNLFGDFTIDVEPQFLIQRSFKGNTESYVKKGDFITGEKVRRNTEFNDYFALNSQINGKINNWDLEIDKELNSFDPDKFPNALRVKADLSKEVTLLNSKWRQKYFGVYRDRVWNGSIGESEIYIGYGSKLEKQNTWEVDGVANNQILSLGLANFKAENLKSQNLITSLKGNFFYSLEQNYPIRTEKITNKFIDSSYKYIPQPIKKGLSLNTKVEILYSLYEDGNDQGYLGLGAGPELVFGNFKDKVFDYTKISFLPFYKIKNGDSVFKFDQVSEKFTLDIAFDQQLYGPLIIKNIATLNLDSDSIDYGNFINSRISLNWQKRSYEFGIFYQPHNEAGGISFNLFGFK